MSRIRLFAQLRREAAVSAVEIVLITSGFLVVGSAFGAVVVTTGVTSSGQVERTLNDALSRSGDGLELRGPVVAVTDGQRAVAVTADVALAVGGDGVSLDQNAPLGRTVVSYIDEANVIHDLPYGVQWTVGDGDDVLESGELAALLIDVSSIEPAITSGRRFQIEVRPSTGAYLVIRRTMPPGSHLDTIVNLH